jgi:predicted unusual protein kinase regulating ubiquinone biosynthesis (AarF/ABC1/UbiB family)
MRELVEKRPPREAIKRRELQIRGRLAEYGLASPRQPSRDAGATVDESRFRRLSAALVSLGPVFSSFGIYLSSRADLLPAKNCLELAAIPGRAEVSPFNRIWSLIGREMGRRPTEIYAAFDEEPFESRLTFQSHRAQLRSGEAVIVRAVHPEFEKLLAYDLELLSLLNGVLAGVLIEGAIEDFRLTLKQQIDFVREAEMMAEFARDAIRSKAVKAPTAHGALCTSKILTLEHLSGSNLGDLISAFNGREIKGGLATAAPPPLAGIDCGELASLLCNVWLRQSLQGSVFPIDPCPENILILSNRQIAFTGGFFAGLQSYVKTNLFNYLVAAAAHDPDSACSYLLREMRRGKGAASEEEVRRRLRQVIPFRDGGWRDSGNCPSLAEYLFVHWRFARECGYQPQPHLLCFFRGLFQIAAIARRLGPGRDPLMEGLQDLRFNAVFAEFRDMVSLGRLGDGLDKYAAVMTELPQRLNDALTIAIEGHARLKCGEIERIKDRSRKNSSTTVIALLLLLMSVALLSHHMSTSAGAKVWADRIGALAFMFVGTLLLRASCRPP